MTVLRTFLDSLLNFLSNNQENITKFSTVRQKSGVKFELPETQFEKTVSDKIVSKTYWVYENDF